MSIITDLETALEKAALAKAEALGRCRAASVAALAAKDAFDVAIAEYDLAFEALADSHQEDYS